MDSERPELRALLQLRKELGASLFAAERGKLFLARPDSLAVEMLDLATGMSEATFDLPAAGFVQQQALSSSAGPRPRLLDGLLACGSLLLGHHTHSAAVHFTVFDTRARAGVGVAFRLLRPGQRLVSVCAGHAGDGDAFFFALSGEASAYCLLAAGDAGGGHRRCVVSAPSRVDGGGGGGLVSLVRHPWEPALLATMSQGAVRVLLYSALRRQMLREQGLDLGEGEGGGQGGSATQTSIYGPAKDDDGGGGGGGGLDVRTGQGWDEASWDGHSDAGSTVGSTAGSSSVQAAQEGRGRPSSFSGMSFSLVRRSAAPEGGLLQSAHLTPPAPGMAAQQLAVSPGGLAAVLWRGEGGALCIYDTRQLAARPDASGVAPTLALRPLASVAVPAWLVPSPASASAPPRTGLAFHPAEPVLLLLVDRDPLAVPTSRSTGPEGAGQRWVCALSLQDASLRVVGLQQLPSSSSPTLQGSSHPNPAAWALACCPHTGRVLVRSGPASAALCVLSLSPQWRRMHGFTGAMVVTGVSTPPRAFVEGDGAAREGGGPEGVEGGAWPLCLAVRASAQVQSQAASQQMERQGASLGRPVSVAQAVFRLHLPLLLRAEGEADRDKDAAAGSATEWLGALMGGPARGPGGLGLGLGLGLERSGRARGPSAGSGLGLDNLGLRRPGWGPVPPADLVPPQQALFSPAALRHARFPPPTQPVAPGPALVPGLVSPCIVALAPGTLWSGGADTIAGEPSTSPRDRERGAVERTLRLSSLTAQPCVLFLRLSTDQSDCAVAAYRDAAWWDQGAGAGPLVLAISADGRALSLLSVRPDAPGPVQLRVLPVLPALWALWPGEGLLPPVLFSARAPRTGRDGRDGRAATEARREALLLSLPGQPERLDPRAALGLRVDETALDAAWQPLSLGRRHGAGGGETAFCPPAGVQLVGLLTSQRVLLLAAGPGHTLRPLAQLAHSPPAAPRAAPTHTHRAFLRGLAATAPCPADPASGLSWVGAALIFARESGALCYLLPGAPRPCPGPGPNAALQLERRRGLGLPPADAPAALCGALCSLPRGPTSAGGTWAPVVCLPDRVLLAACDGAFSSAPLRLLCRPLLPAEPLLLSLLSLLDTPSSPGLGPALADPYPNAAPEARARREEALAAATSLLCTYLPARPLPGGSSGAGALPSAQASRALAAALADAGPDFALLAALVVGVAPAVSGAPQSAEPPTLRWLPPALRFCLAVSAGRPCEAALGLVQGVQPELLEPFLDPASYVDLPHPQSRAAQQLADGAAALRAGAEGPCPEAWLAQACRLADLAGRDALLADLLLQAVALPSSAAPSGPSGPRTALLALSRVLQQAGAAQGLVRRIDERLGLGLGLAQGLVRRIDERLGGPVDAKAIREAGEAGALEAVRVAGPRVRSSMLPLPSSPALSAPNPNPNSSSPALSASTAPGKEGRGRPGPTLRGPGKDKEGLSAGSKEPPGPGPDALTVLEARQRALLAASRALGPPSSLGKLSLDRLEDSVGARLRLEGLSQHQPDAPFLSASATHAGVAFRGAPALDPSLPSGWVQGLGEGKDWERLCGYWRLSDVARMGEEGFASSEAGPAGARLCLLDLSRFSGAPLELFAREPSLLALEPSASPLDPGDDHEKVGFAAGCL